MVIEGSIDLGREGWSSLAVEVVVPSVQNAILPRTEEHTRPGNTQLVSSLPLHRTQDNGTKPTLSGKEQK